MMLPITIIPPDRKATRPGLHIAAYKPEDITYMIGVKKQTLATWRMEHRGPRFIRMEGVMIRYPADDFWKWWRKQTKGARDE